MQTDKNKFQSVLNEKSIDSLNSFSKTELNIDEENSIEKDDYYAAYRKKLHLAVEKFDSGESKTYDIDELDAMLEKTIAKYEK